LRRLIGLFFFLLIISCSATLAAPTWEVQVDSPTLKIIRDIFALNYSTAIAVGHDQQIYKTTDYGATWTAKTANNSAVTLRSVYFPTNQIGYAVGESSAGSNHGVVYKTTDGGENWSNICNFATNESERLFTVFFASSLEGWVNSYNGTFDTRMSSWYTTNGGLAWDEANGCPYASLECRGLSFSNASNGWLVGNSGTIYNSIDGGQSWNEQTSGTTVNLKSVFFADNNNGWSVGDLSGGGKGLTLKTANGGVNWSPVDSSSSCKLNACDFTQYSAGVWHGWAVGESSTDNIQKTTNNGTSWVTEFGYAGASLYGIDMVDNHFGWAVGGSSQGCILRYHDSPSFTSLTPATFTQGQTNVTVTIEGDNFLPDLAASGITFSSSGITINTFTRISISRLVLDISIAAGAATGLGNITITNPDTGTVTATNIYSVNPVGVTPPTITGIRIGTSATNEIGRGADKTMIITGTNFLPGPTVTFSDGGLTINSLTNDATTITMNVTVAATAVLGWRGLTVQNSDTGITTASHLFKVNEAPTITAIVDLPSIAAVTGYAGASNVRYIVKGTGFVNGAQVSFSPSGITVNSVTYSSDTALIIDVSYPTAVTIGSYTIIVTNPDGGMGTVAGQVTVAQQSAKPTVNPTRTVVSPYKWNPKTGPLTFQFDLQKAGHYYLNLFTINGEKVYNIDLGVRDAKIGKATWDGLTYTGHGIPNGIFQAKLICDNQVVHTYKVVVQYR